MSPVSFVLIHSPLVGPSTWDAVAQVLRADGCEAVVPALATDPRAGEPPSRQHIRAVERALQSVPRDRPVVLVGHSGAGPLLPSVGYALGQPVSVYVFVDCDLPRDGASRFDLFDPPEQADGFRARARDGLLPPMREDQLTVAIPDEADRRQFAAELRPVPLSVYEETLSVPEGWPDAPCTYLQLTPAYPASVELARARGWPSHDLAAGHFHMLVDPGAVARGLQGLVAAT